jgi:hypothetical protein
VLELLPALREPAFDGATFPQHLFLADSEPGKFKPAHPNGDTK